MRMYIGQGILPTICHWVAALGQPGRVSISFGAARTFSETANKAAGFWGTTSDLAEHYKQGGLVVRVISREHLRAPAPSFNTDSRTIGLRRTIFGDQS
jgi:hypothetical protein